MSLGGGATRSRVGLLGLLGLVGLVALCGCDAVFRFDEDTDVDGRPFPDASVPDAAPAVRCTTDPSCGATGLRCAVDSGACVACLDDRDCASTAATPHCEKTQHRCVECNANGDCATGNLCEQTSHRCHEECHDEDDAMRCLPARGGCDSARRICIECRGNADCATSTAGAVCDVQGGRCVECVSDVSCPSARPRCDGLTGKCGACSDASDCAAASPICDPRALACVTP